MERKTNEKTNENSGKNVYDVDLRCEEKLKLHWHLK